MGIYVFTRDVLFDLLGRDAARNFGQEIVPAALGRYVVRAYLHRGYWADVGTVRSFYQANLLLTHPDAPFHFHDRDRPIFTRPRHLPGARFVDCALDDAIVGEGCFIEHARVEQSVVGIRTQIRPGATIRRSVLLGADYYATDDAAPAIGGPALGIGRNVVLDGVIVDKNARIGDGARLTNESRIGHADGHGYCIRDGIIVVPKDAVVEPGTFV
jgi:glucose-1-phosphate adenylyltransferase